MVARSHGPAHTTYITLDSIEAAIEAGKAPTHKMLSLMMQPKSSYVPRRKKE